LRGILQGFSTQVGAKEFKIVGNGRPQTCYGSIDASKSFYDELMVCAEKLGMDLKEVIPKRWE
jgi:hypothetical protein